MAALVLAGAVAAAPAHAEPFVIAGSDTQVMAASEGTQYRVHVHVPATPPPAQGFPVLYLLDGDDSFAIAVATMQRMARFGGDEGMGEGIVVAVNRSDGDLAGRVLDYTPASSAVPELRGRPTGGAEAFRAFLADVLMPAIAREHRIDTGRQAIWGHSLGGLFVLDTLMREPELFGTYVATSPSLWFPADQAAPDPARTAAARPRLLLSVGEAEAQQRSPAGAFDAIATNRALAHRLAAIEGLRVEQRVMSGESHATTPLPGIGEAVLAAFLKTPTTQESE